MPTRYPIDRKTRLLLRERMLRRGKSSRDLERMLYEGRRGPITARLSERGSRSFGQPWMVLRALGESPTEFFARLDAEDLDEDEEILRGSGVGRNDLEEMIHRKVAEPLERQQEAP